MRSGVPTAPSRTRMRARVSSHIFLMSSPFRPIMLPTLRTGTISRNTQSPGQPGHLLSAIEVASPLTVVVVSWAPGSGWGPESGSGFWFGLLSAVAVVAVWSDSGTVIEAVVVSDAGCCRSGSVTFAEPFSVGWAVAIFCRERGGGVWLG